MMIITKENTILIDSLYETVQKLSQKNWTKGGLDSSNTC